jgi:hypothetical protein
MTTYQQIMSEKYHSTAGQYELFQYIHEFWKLGH